MSHFLLRLASTTRRRPRHVKGDPGGEILGRFANQYRSSALTEHFGRRCTRMQSPHGLQESYNCLSAMARLDRSLPIRQTTTVSPKSR